MTINNSRYLLFEFPLSQPYKNSKDYLNPMDIPISHVGDKEALRLKSDFIITFGGFVIFYR